MDKYIQLQDSNCRSCMRCVRVCPTKAMMYVDHQPVIYDNECILCGKCFVVCPHQAKKVKSELQIVKQWINNNQRVVLSVAPSFVMVWQNFPRLAEMAKGLGFFMVEETAVAASVVSGNYHQLIESGTMKNIITTCCPSVVSLIEKEFPQMIDQLAPVMSPMVAHGKMLKQQYGDDIKVVFLSPCISKLKESKRDEFNQYVDAVISMPEFKQWLDKSAIASIDQPWTKFDGQISRMYPVNGGILNTLDKKEGSYRFISVDGINRIKETLKQFSDQDISGYFIEVNACNDSCVCGPLLANYKQNEWQAQTILRENVKDCPVINQRFNDIDLSIAWSAKPRAINIYSEESIKDMLYMMGKTHRSKELNCGMCGYETCREKAIAILDGKADPKLCLPQALEEAQSLSNLVIENTPNGIIILNSNLDIQEINPSASHLLNLDHVDPIGFPILSVLPNPELEKLLKKPEKIQYMKAFYPQYNSYIDHAITYLEDKELYIIILMDFTVEEAKEKVIKKMQQDTIEVAQRVIDDQMRTVQEVASLLGESTAKSKVALSKLMKAMHEND